MIPLEWLPKVAMKRIHIHWTGGGHIPNAVDKRAYHLIGPGGGGVVRGDFSIAANKSPIRGNYAAHTLNANGDAIGYSMACMADSKESPFNPGVAPLTRTQWDEMIENVAQMCIFFGIEVTPQTVMTHAEVQSNLGIKQKNKWDVTRLAFDPNGPKGAKQIGDMMRKQIQAEINVQKLPQTKKPKDDAIPGAPVVDKVPPMALKGSVSASSLNFRDGPNGKRISSIPFGTRLDIVEVTDDGWYKVLTPLRHAGWVSAEYVDLDK